MKKITIILLSLILTSSTCYYNDWNYSKYTPILMTRTELESSIKFLAARDFNSLAKVYVKGDTIYVTQKYAGVHVINNSNPQSPQKLGFISIPGCVDIAVKGKILYADNAVDLISIDISNLNQLIVKERIKNIFPEITPPDNSFIPSKFEEGNRPANTIIIGWELKH